ncbi:hypothetical protein [Methanoregula sp.]|jgi:hypothetical protein|uniref:hypothetical protein n=1 Tax=Methanoregula sp. TaxID=2052170 RepID=UPI003C190767
MNDNRNGDFLYSNPEQQNDSSSWFRKSLPEIPVTSANLLEYSGAFLGIAGWLGVRQIGSPAAQEIGFVVWIISGLFLIAWGYHTKARAIMLINVVNVIMAASAFAALV